MEDDAREHLQTKDIKYVFITKDAADLKQRLVENQPSPLEYNSQMPDDILEEDKVIQNLDLELGADDVRIVPADDMFE